MQRVPFRNQIGDVNEICVLLGTSFLPEGDKSKTSGFSSLDVFHYMHVRYFAKLLKQVPES